MKFQDKYTKDKTKEPDKIEISVDAFALGDVVQDLVDVLKNFGGRQW